MNAKRVKVGGVILLIIIVLSTIIAVIVINSGGDANKNTDTSFVKKTEGQPLLKEKQMPALKRSLTDKLETEREEDTTVEDEEQLEVVPRPAGKNKPKQRSAIDVVKTENTLPSKKIPSVKAPKTSLQANRPCDIEFVDDLENVGKPFKDDSKIIARILESTKRNLKEKDEAKGPLRSRIFVWNGDITKIGTDAIVNAANEPCDGGDGIDGAIHRAAGGNFLKRIKEKLGDGVRCPTGTARVISVVNFNTFSENDPESKKKENLHENTKFILQAVGPMGENPDMLKSTYLSALQNAKKIGARHVAFNCISTGIYGYPAPDASQVAVSTVKQWMNDNLDSKLKVVFVIYGGPDDVEYKKQMPHYHNTIMEHFRILE